MTLKTLANYLKEKGWSKMHGYPRPYLWEYLERKHPLIIGEYKKWFDKEVRDPKFRK